MGGHSKAKEPMSWSDENERTFIGILYEYVKAGKLQCSTFTKDQWGKINQEMIEATKFDYGVERLKGKWNRLRIEHRLFSQLLGHTGVTWDPNTNKVNAAEEVWQHFYTMSKTEFKTFRKDGCKNYELLGEIFGGTTATGGLSNASTNPPPSSDDERRLEDNFLTKGVHVHVINDDEQISSRASDDTSTNERRRKKHKANNVEKLESCMDKWSSSIEMRNEEAELRMRYLKGKIAKVEGKSPKPNDSQSDASDPYSDMVCMNILNGIDGVSDDVYAKAVKAFDNPNFRRRFVMMPEHRRLPVLERLD